MAIVFYLGTHLAKFPLSVRSIHSLKMDSHGSHIFVTHDKLQMQPTAQWSHELTDRCTHACLERPTWINGEGEGEALGGPGGHTCGAEGAWAPRGTSGGGRERRMRENESVSPRRNSEQRRLGHEGRPRAGSSPLQQRPLSAPTGCGPGPLRWVWGQGLSVGTSTH